MSETDNPSETTDVRPVPAVPPRDEPHADTRKERRRWPWIVAIVVVFFLVFGIVGSRLAPEAGDDASSTEPGTTTAPRVTSAVRTTTAPRVTSAVRTTTAPRYDAFACAEALYNEADIMTEMVTTSGLAAGSFDALDIDSAQYWWDLLQTEHRQLGQLRRQTDRDCENAPHSELADLRDARRAIDSGWREMQQVCREDMAPLGFDC